MTLVGHWPLDEDSGDALDYSGNERHGTLDGSVTQGVDGLLSTTAYEFSSSTLVEYPGSYNYSGASDWSFATWLTANVASAGQAISMWHPRGDADIMVGIGVSGSQAAAGEVYILTWDGSEYTLTGGDVDDGNWHHVAVTYDSDSSTYRLYLDGVEVNSGNLGAPNSTSGRNTFGGRDVGSGPSDHVPGKMEDVRLYARTLSPNEIAYLYQVSQQGRYTTSKREF